MAHGFLSLTAGMLVFVQPNRAVRGRATAVRGFYPETPMRVWPEKLTERNA
jgi:hypothetical protein